MLWTHSVSHGGVEIGGDGDGDSQSHGGGGSGSGDVVNTFTEHVQSVIVKLKLVEIVMVVWCGVVWCSVVCSKQVKM